MESTREHHFQSQWSPKNLLPVDLEKGQSQKLARWMSEPVKELERNGALFLPGLTHWLEELSPLKRPEAWTALHDPHVRAILEASPLQERHYILNDEGVIDDQPQLTVGFAAKSEKSHLTLVEGGEQIATNPLLPAAVRTFLDDGFRFLKSVRRYLGEILPETQLPSILRVRIFEYHSSDLLVHLRPHPERTPGMRSHCDGSVVTIVIAESDRALHCKLKPNEVPIARSDNRPFGLMIPGIAADHDLNIPPTEHLVLSSGETRVSITAVLAPDLGTSDADLASEQLRKWRLNKGVVRRGALGQFRFLSLVRPAR